VDLIGIRQGLADGFATVPGVRVFDTIPFPLPVGQYDCVVIQPDSPYIEYSEVAGMADKNYVYMLVTIVTQSTDPRTAQNRLDELLSCGELSPRSLRTALAANGSAGGEACQVIVQTATTRQITVEGNEQSNWAADISLKILARC
jgi:hypothetical protein